MRFFIDRCAGTLIAAWLRTQGHDVVESRNLGADPGDRVLLEWAAQQSRILITIDTDFGQLVFLQVFERDNAIHPLIQSFVHGAHATVPEFADHAIAVLEN